MDFQSLLPQLELMAHGPIKTAARLISGGFSEKPPRGVPGKAGQKGETTVIK
jgi:hypothetical protein